MWAEYLGPVAKEMLDAFTQLVEDDEFWREQQFASLRLTRLHDLGVRARIEELIHSNLAGLLDLLGYQEPPASVELAADVADAFQSIVEQESPTVRAELIVAARSRLSLYNWRLRRLVREWDESGGQDPGVGRKVLMALRKGARAAAPGVLAAAVTGAVFPPAAAPGATAAVLHGLDEGTKALLGAAVKTSATAALGITMATETTGSLSAAVDVAGKKFCWTTRELSRLVQDVGAAHLQDLEDVVRVFTIQAVRAGFELLQTLALNRAFSGVVAPSVQEAIDALNELLDWFDLPYGPDLEHVRSSVVEALERAADKVALFSELYVG